MTWRVLVFWFGAAVEGAGVVIALGGFLRTWREHAHGEPFLPWVVRVRAVLRRWWARLTRREVDVRHVRGLPVSVTVAPTAARGVAREPVPDPSADPDVFREYLERQFERFRQADRELHARADGLRTELGEVSRQVSEDLAADVSQLQRQVDEVAVGGLRLEAAGLVLVLVGLVLTSLSGAPT